MAFGDRTWLLDGGGASASDCAPAIQDRDAVKGAQTDTARLGAVVPVSGAVWTPVLSWTTEDSIGILDWPLGQYIGSFRILTIPTGTFAGRCLMRKVTSGCTLVGGVSDVGFFTATGTYVYNNTFNPTVGAAGDRLQIILETILFAGGSGRLEVDVAHADSFLKAPLQPGQPPHHLPGRVSTAGLTRR